MKSRLIQLVARYLGLAMVSVAVWFAPGITDDQKAQFDEPAMVIATAVIGFIGILVDLIIHRVNNGGFLSAPRASGTVSQVDAKKGLMLALMLMPAAVFVGGCSPGAGQATREAMLAPWAVNEGWPLIKPYAEAGIAAKIEAGELTEATAMSPRETIRLFDEAVSQLGGR